MRFLADMGISQAAVAWLRTQGHDTTHLRDEGLHTLENGEIFTKAFRESRIILTWDLILPKSWLYRDVTPSVPSSFAW